MGMMAMLSLSWTQSFFNAVMGEDYYSGSARAASMGFTRLTVDPGYGFEYTNPAGLAALPGMVVTDYTASGTSVLERRSMPLKDMFGDFLEDADYAVNRNFYPTHSATLSTGLQFGEVKAGAGLSFSPYRLFDYRYEEEVRDRNSLEDGIIGIKDPIIGYHILDSEGMMNMVSAGAGIGFRLLPDATLRLGVGINMIQSTEINVVQKVEEISDEGTNLSFITPYDFTYKLDNASFSVFSAELLMDHGIRFVAAYEGGIRTDRMIPDSLSLPDSLGLSPQLIQHLEQYYLDGLNANSFETPGKFRLGISYFPRSAVPMNLILEWERQFYSDIPNMGLKDTYTWRIGIEYLALSKIPVRIGYFFSESPIPFIDPVAAFTFGTGRTLGNLTVDIAGRYSLSSYDYPDLFPVDGDVRPDLDTVSETRFDLRLSLNYKLDGLK